MLRILSILQVVISLKFTGHWIKCMLFEATLSKCIRSSKYLVLLPTEFIPYEAFHSITQIFDAFIQGELKASLYRVCSNLNYQFHIFIDACFVNNSPKRGRL